jgi:xanthine dehydrogenase accessory factor
MNIYQKITEFTSKGMPLVVVSAVDKKGEGPVEVGKKMLVTKDNQAFGTVGGGALEYNARELCKDIMKTRKSIMKKYLLNEGKVLKDTETLPMTCGGVVTLFFEYIGPKEYIYIFGAGHVGQALTNVLNTMNFHISVIDEREEVVNQFIGGDKVILSPFTKYIADYGLEEGSFVVVCTPSHKSDYNVINKVIEENIKLKYLGMLCSPEKLKDYLNKTYDKFGDNIDLHNFYSPIGLDLGGGSPEEIAISITAEILAVSNNKKGHIHMRESLNNGKHYYWKD